MKTKPSVLAIQMPSALKHQIERIANQQSVSINQFALYDFTKRVAQSVAQQVPLNAIKDLPPSGRILDISCGTGDLAIAKEAP